MSSRRPLGGSEARRSEFKNQGLTQDEFRRRREETSVELRKAKKEDSLNKRRSILDTSATASAIGTAKPTTISNELDYFNEAEGAEANVIPCHCGNEWFIYGFVFVFFVFSIA